jgi:hypothetical protein
VSFISYFGDMVYVTAKSTLIVNNSVTTSKKSLISKNDLIKKCKLPLIVMNIRCFINIFVRILKFHLSGSSCSPSNIVDV